MMETTERTWALETAKAIYALAAGAPTPELRRAVRGSAQTLFRRYGVTAKQRKKAIIACLRKNLVVTTREICERSGFRRDDVLRVFDELEREGVVELSGGTGPKPMLAEWLGDVDDDA